MLQEEPRYIQRPIPFKLENVNLIDTQKLTAKKKKVRTCKQRCIPDVRHLILKIL